LVCRRATSDPKIHATVSIHHLAKHIQDVLLRLLLLYWTRVVIGDAALEKEAADLAWYAFHEEALEPFVGLVLDTMRQLPKSRRKVVRLQQRMADESKEEQ
jgi:hypothetical protein